MKLTPMYTDPGHIRDCRVEAPNARHPLTGLRAGPVPTPRQAAAIREAALRRAAEPKPFDRVKPPRWARRAAMVADAAERRKAERQQWRDRPGTMYKRMVTDRGARIASGRRVAV